MGNPHKLAVWHRARELSVNMHVEVRRFPRAGAPGLKGQLQRAADGIPTNIAEGAGRPTDAEFARFLDIAIGSANECETHLLLASRLSFLAVHRAEELLDELRQIRMMMYGLLRRLRPPE